MATKDKASQTATKQEENHITTYQVLVRII